MKEDNHNKHIIIKKIRPLLWVSAIIAVGAITIGDIYLFIKVSAVIILIIVCWAIGFVLFMTALEKIPEEAGPIILVIIIAIWMSPSCEDKRFKDDYEVRYGLHGGYCE